MNNKAAKEAAIVVIAAAAYSSAPFEWPLSYLPSEDVERVVTQMQIWASEELQKRGLLTVENLQAYFNGFFEEEEAEVVTVENLKGYFNGFSEEGEEE